MGYKIKSFLKKFQIKRTTILILLFVFMSSVLVRKLFQLQIMQGEDYISTFQSQTTKTRSIKSTRGNIYDRDGKLLAHNELAYALTLEDNGSYDTTKEKNLKLNAMLYQLLQTMKKNGDTINRSNFHIELDHNGEFAFDVSEGFTLNRFRADVYGYSYIEELKENESNATADDIMQYFCDEDMFYIANGTDVTYSKEEQELYGLPAFFEPSYLTDIAIMRYQLSNNRFMKYMAVTIAANVSEETVVSVEENKSFYQGIDVVEDSIRIYEDHESLGPILGYTGQASSEELQELLKEDENYSNDAIIGKTGLEQYLETTLHGKDGQETVSVDNMGKVLNIDEETKVEPVAGDDVYLTIKTDWQKDIYEILKQRVAGVLLSKIDNVKTFDVSSISDTTQIRIPIYDCYFQLINNNIIDIEAFNDENASDTEKAMYAKFQQKQQEIFDKIKKEFSGESNIIYKEQTEEMQEYLSYIDDTFLMEQEQILSPSKVDDSDKVYKSWYTGDISLNQYLTYAAGQNWIDISKIDTEDEYLDSSEVYNELAAYTTEKLKTDLGFSKLLYKYMLLEDRISGTEVCLALYEQGVLDKENGDGYTNLSNGLIDSYNFLINKIFSLEIEPAMLALDPCSASAVVTDVNTGEVLACVTYPGYNNNLLSNNMDISYYSKLASDLSSPFFNKATQQKTAPGSTFKPAAAIAGILNGFLTLSTTITCTGSFDLVEPHIACWNTLGCGTLDLSSALEKSCNTFFNTIGYELGKNSEGTYREDITLAKLKETASLMALDQESGIEMTESEPQVSDAYGVPSYMGQGTNSYTTTQLARYAALLANSGTAYKLTILDKITDSEGNVLKESTPEVVSTVSISQDFWNSIHTGMRRVVTSNTIFSSLKVEAAGKTGTAQEQTTRPDHGLFIGYAPYDNPEYAIAVRMANGYSSGNTCYIADDIFKYIFNTEDRKSLITGCAASETSDVSHD